MNRRNKLNRQEVIRALQPNAYLVVNNPNYPFLQNITSEDLLADAQFSLTIADLVTATETSIAAFAAASASYDFDKGDLIQLAANGSGVVAVYYYNGGTKTNVNSYITLDLSKIDWANVINKPTSITELTANDSIYDQEAIPIIAADFDERILHDGAGNAVVNWYQKILYDVADKTSISWNTRLLQDSTQAQSINWESRQLKNSSGVIELDWNTSGKLTLPNLPVYANNAAALAGGLTAGMLYKTSAAGDAIVMVTNAA